MLLTWYDQSGKRLADAGAPSAYWAVDLSHDGARFAVTRYDSTLNTNDIWISSATNGAASRFTTDPADDTYPAWSFDGHWIAYVTRGRGEFLLHVKDSSGAQGERTVYSSPRYLAMPTWSPDGRHILFSTGSDLLSIDPQQPGATPQTWLSTGFQSGLPQFSPDGRWVAYVSNETGRPEVYIRSFANPASGKWQISTNEGSQPRWRADGQELYYVEQHKQMMAVAVKASGESFAAEQPQPLFPVHMAGLDYARFEYGVAPDGKRFLVQSPNVEDERPIRIVVNWDSALKPNQN
jgi:eukaryotic-like serine/threonine-protein kinase